MKYLLVLLLSLSVSANEIKRIESVVKDIQDIRAEHASCVKLLATEKSLNDKSKLTAGNEAEKYKKLLKAEEKKNLLISIDLNKTKKYRKLFDEEKRKNTSLILDLNQSENYQRILEQEKVKTNSLLLKIDSIQQEKQSQEDRKAEETKKLEQEIKNLNSNIEVKNQEISQLKNKVAALEKFKKNTLQLKKKERVLCKEENTFPALIMKDNKSIQKKVYFRAKTFELLNDASIFNSINGKKVADWKAKSLFTSNVKTQEWMKITGYFIDDKWKRSRKELWIRIKNTKQR